MGAVGYIFGDPRKVNRSGDTMTGDLVLPGDPDQPLEAATKQYVDAGGGGGGGTPSNTVVTETSFGQGSTAGAATDYSRGDHTHGTPAAPSVPSAASSVVSETSFGQASAVGVGTAYARNDHTHGTPAAPSIPSASATVVTETTYSQASTAGVGATWSRGDHTHGTPALPTPADIGAQPLDSDLTAIAALAPTNDDVIQRKAGAWTNRTMAQLKADLAITAADVGAVPTARTITTTAPITGGGDLSANRTFALATNGITNALAAQMAANTLKGNNTAGLANAADLTVAQVKTLLAYTPGDISAVPTTRTLTASTGLTGGGDLSADRSFAIAADGVTNTLLANMATLTLKGNNTGGTADPVDLTVAQTKTMLAYTPGDIGAQPLDSDLTAIAALTPTNDDIIQRKAGAWTNRTMAQLLVDLGAVAGPASATDNTLPRYDGTSGKLIQGSGIAVTDTDNDMSGFRKTVRSVGTDPTGSLDSVNLTYTPSTSTANMWRIQVSGTDQSWGNEIGFLRGRPADFYKDDAIVRAIQNASLVAQTGWAFELQNAARTGVLWGIRWLDGRPAFGDGSVTPIVGLHTIQLASAASVPTGLPAGTLIVRT